MCLGKEYSGDLVVTDCITNYASVIHISGTTQDYSYSLLVHWSYRSLTLSPTLLSTSQKMVVAPNSARPSPGIVLTLQNTSFAHGLVCCEWFVFCLRVCVFMCVEIRQCY